MARPPVPTRATGPRLPLSNDLVAALAPTTSTEVPQAADKLRIGTVTQTSPLRVTLTGPGQDALYSAEKLTSYSVTLSDSVLVAVVGQRVIIIGKIG